LAIFHFHRRNNFHLHLVWVCTCLNIFFEAAYWSGWGD
jgi:hypothetical protein